MVTSSGLDRMGVCAFLERGTLFAGVSKSTYLTDAILAYSLQGCYNSYVSTTNEKFRYSSTHSPNYVQQNQCLVYIHSSYCLSPDNHVSHFISTPELLVVNSYHGDDPGNIRHKLFVSTVKILQIVERNGGLTLSLSQLNPPLALGRWDVKVDNQVGLLPEGVCVREREMISYGDL